jgi:tetratricopeptide (TPR) repeat protein
MVNLKEMISADVIEKYQTIMRHNPASQVFAPLADAYLERGLTLQAEELAKTGTERHPLFAAGFLVLGKIYLKSGKLDDAETALQKCVELSPQNILAHQFLGDVYLALKNPIEALRAYKMTLFLNPYSTKAKKAVEKLEAVSALEFDEDTFSMAKLSDLKQVQKNQPSFGDEEASAKPMRSLLQLVDAFLVRGDRDQAANLLKEAKAEFGAHPEIESRLKKISSLASLSRLQAKTQAVTQPAHPSPAPRPSPSLQVREAKLNRLYDMLRNVRIAKMMNEQNP